MKDKLREQISALVDGELDDTEARLLIRRFARDPELGEIWERYHACGDLISGQPGSLAVGDLEVEAVLGPDAGLLGALRLLR
jgi:sigma-E factor negative regulatory protein RseA